MRDRTSRVQRIRPGLDKRLRARLSLCSTIQSTGSISEMKPLVQVPFKYGMIASLVGFLLVVVLYYINRHPFLIQPYMDFRILLFGVFIFFSLKEYRDYYQGGILYTWEGLIGSFIFVSTFAVVASVLI